MVTFLGHVTEKSTLIACIHDTNHTKIHVTEVVRLAREILTKLLMCLTTYHSVLLNKILLGIVPKALSDNLQMQIT